MPLDDNFISHSILYVLKKMFSVSYQLVPGRPVEMQSSDPATRPGPKFRPGRAFCGAWIKSVGFCRARGSRSQRTLHCARIRAMLERGSMRCWPGSMLGSADFVRCRSGLGLGFWRNFCTSGALLHNLRSSCESSRGAFGAKG